MIMKKSLLTILGILIIGIVLVGCSDSKAELARQEEELKQQQLEFDEEFVSVVNDIVQMNENSDFVVGLVYSCWNDSFGKYNPEFEYYYSFLISNVEPTFSSTNLGTVGAEHDIFHAIWGDDGYRNLGGKKNDLIQPTIEIIYSFRDKRENIEITRNGLKEQIRSLKDKSNDNTKEQIELLESFYVESTQYAELALMASGSYNSYIDNVNNHTSTIDSLMKKIDLYMPEEPKIIESQEGE